jgi:pimeloyl-ACP methyl ester carboxylesterase
MKKCMVLILFFVFVLGSCGDGLLSGDYQGGDWFYLENKGAIMPVWVKGNKQCEVFVIFLHGGPGGSAMIDALYNAYKELEMNYAFVYWDQRGSGLTQGNTKPDSLTIDQFVEDLEKLVTLIRYKYNNPNLFLIGHSWGGTLGTAFLINPINQTHISGWIPIDSAHNWCGSDLLSIEWVKERATEKINLGKNVEYWEKQIDWYSGNPKLTNYDNISRHSENIDKLNGAYYNSSNVPEVPSYLMFSSPYNFSFLLNNYFMFSNNRLDFTNLNLVPEIHKIKIPSLILWGRHDGVTPVALAYETYDNIGSENKYIYIFENSAHNAPFEEPELFVEKVREFIDKNKL